MKLIGKKAVLISREEKTDDIGNEYLETKWDYQGQKFSINTDEYGYHAKIDNRKETTEINMDEGGLVGWVLKWLGIK
jgi:hypothetical protein